MLDSQVRWQPSPSPFLFKLKSGWFKWKILVYESWPFNFLLIILFISCLLFYILASIDNHSCFTISSSSFHVCFAFRCQLMLRQANSLVCASHKVALTASNIPSACVFVGWFLLSFHYALEICVKDCLEKILWFVRTIYVSGFQPPL